MLRAALILAIGFMLTPLATQSFGAAEFGAAFAQTGALPEQKQAELIAATRLRDIIEVVSAEGVAAGPNIEADMFPGRGGLGWQQDLERIYAVDPLMEDMTRDIGARLTEADADILISFLTSPLGLRVVEGEVSARAAMLDPAVDDAAHEMAQTLRREGDPRVEQIAEFIEVYDLVTSNVVGGLNSNYAFYQGLASGGALPGSMTEDQIVNEVWSQQEIIRADTEDWLYAYLLASYSDLSDDDMQTYIAFSETEAAQAFNRVLFETFGTVFNAVSRELGRAVAARMLAQDI
jgi:hypothetical protein